MPSKATPDRFVTVWSASPSVSAAASALGISENAARSRASVYRRAGVRLKRMPSGKPPLDVDRLNALIK